MDGMNKAAGTVGSRDREGRGGSGTTYDLLKVSILKLISPPSKVNR